MISFFGCILERYVGDGMSEQMDVDRRDRTLWESTDGRTLGVGKAKFLEGTQEGRRTDGKDE
jgi:hypothetical protein